VRVFAILSSEMAILKLSESVDVSVLSTVRTFGDSDGETDGETDWVRVGAGDTCS